MAIRAGMQSAAGRLERFADRSVTGFVLYRLRWAIMALFALFVFATFGYAALEHYSIVNAAFMTVITLSTVGYGIVGPLDSAGRAYTIGVIVASFTGLVYSTAMLTSLFTTGEVGLRIQAQRGRHMREGLSDHVIVVGFGRVGQAAAHGVTELGRSCLVIDRNPDREQTILDAGYVPLIGDASSEAHLALAGLGRAHALIAAADDDAINLVVTLTARALRPDLRIISRVNEAGWQRRIEQAGANVAESPYRSYGLSLAASAITSTVVGMHSVPVLGLVAEEIEVAASSPQVGRAVSEIGLDQPILVIGLRRNQTLHRWDEIVGEVQIGDVLLALGTPQAVQDFAQTF